MKGVRSGGSSVDLVSVNVAIGERLASIRKSKNMTQSAVGRLLGITFQQVQKYESGSNRLSAASLFALSKLLEVPLSKFFPEAD